MRVSTRVHGMVDYLIGAALVLYGLLAETGGGSGTMVLVAAGAAMIGSALVTEFELGVVRFVQIPVHLWLDGVIGLLVAISPWALGFYREVWLPHLLVGIFLGTFAFLTQTVPGYDRRRARSAA
jgi:hypothetical protein